MDQTPSTAPVATIIYAGFWRRVAATFVDGSVLFFINIIIAAGAVFLVPAAVKIVGSVVIPLVGFLYMALFESSVYQATVGKQLLGLSVTDMNGNRLTFLRALGRNLAKILSVVIIFIGFIMAGFTEKKQTLHDMIAGTLVVKKQEAKTGLALLVFFAPTIIAMVILYFVVMASFQMFFSTSQAIMHQYGQDDQNAKESTDMDSSASDSQSDAPAPTPTTASEYTALFAAAKAPTIDEVGTQDSFVTTAGPILAHFDKDDLSTDTGGSFSIVFDIADLPNMTAKGATIDVALSHIYTKAGADVLDKTSDFETDPFFTNISLSDFSSDENTTYYEASRNATIKDGSLVSGETFASVTGTVVFTLPTGDGKTFTTSYPFTIKAK